MTRRRAFVLSLLAWVAVWASWLALTHGHHPTRLLALIVTTSLVAAYALAAYVNHLVLLPRFWARFRWRYLCSLVATMLALTAAALAVIRAS